MGDIDADGDLDAVLLGWQRISLHLNRDGILAVTPTWTASSPAAPYRSVALGDVDGDGDLDLVTGNEGRSSHAIFRNTGAGFPDEPSWIAPADTAIVLGGDPYLVDWDRDGDLDLLTILTRRSGPYTTQSSTVLFENDAGAFAAEPTWTAAISGALALGDVDGDGDLDAVVGRAGYQGSGVANTLHLNEDGVLQEIPAWTSGLAVRTTLDVELGDLDGDGDLDLVCGNAWDFLTVYANIGGTFSGEPVWKSELADQNTTSTTLGDVDGDGDLDLVCGNFRQPTTLYRNDAGVLTEVPVWASQPEDDTKVVELADITGNGALDIICGNESQPTTLYGNNPIGYPRIRDRYLDANQTVAIVLVDLDSDGDDDLVTANTEAPCRVYLNEGGIFGPTPWWSSTLPRATTSVATGDLNGDGRPDLAFGNLNQPNMVFFGRYGSFADTPDWEGSVSDSTTSVAIADINRDGYMDLAVGNWDQPNYVYLGSLEGLDVAPNWISGDRASTRGIALGDVDGDGYPELACANTYVPGAPWALYANIDGTFSKLPAWEANVREDAEGVDFGDIDGDADMDLICANGSGPNPVFLNNGGALDPNPAWSGGTETWTSIALALDVDWNGHLDVLHANYKDGQGNHIYLNDAGLLPALPSWESDVTLNTWDAAAADLDGDGDLDLLFASTPDDLYTAWGIGVHYSARNPPYKRNPAAPTDQLPDNVAFLRRVRVSQSGENERRIAFQVLDVESDPAWITADYSYLGSPIWRPARIDGDKARVGPLSSSPLGVDHVVSWDISSLDFDQRDVILRLRVTSAVSGAGSVQHLATYRTNVGPIEPRRPVMTPSATHLSFPVVTLGDSVAVDLTIRNSGNETLNIARIDLPSPEMRITPDVSSFIGPGESIQLTVHLEPRTTTDIMGGVTIQSNDPISPTAEIAVQASIRPLEVRTRLLSPTEEVPLGEAITLVIRPAPEVRVESGYLFHRPSGDPAFEDSIPIVAAEDDFIAIVPGSAVTESGLDYFVRVENSGVAATDPVGAPGDSVYHQRVAGPESLSSTAIPNSGRDYLAAQAIVVSVVLPRGAEFRRGSLYWRLGGDLAYTETPLELGSELLFGTISGTAVGIRGIEYWVEVETLTRRLTDPLVAPELSPHGIVVKVPNIGEDITYPGSAYRMISIPLTFGEEFTGTLEDLLSNDPEFGPYDPVRWRAFRYAPELQRYIELPEDSAAAYFRPEPSRGFWLVARGPSRFTTSPVSGFSTPGDFYPVTLAPGWNQIGTPFAFPVAWDSVLVTTPGVEPELVEPPIAWNISEQTYEMEVPTLEPFRAYWIRNLADTSIVIAVPPRCDSAHVSCGRASDREGTGWRIRIGAVAAGHTDRDNWIGVHTNGRETWDPADRSEPPMNPGKGISLYLPHGGWASHPGSYARDIRGEYLPLDPGVSRSVFDADSAWGHVWCFDIAKSFVEQPPADNVRLQVELPNNLPPELLLFLVDRAEDVAVDLREAGEYLFHAGIRGPVFTSSAARFALVAGSPAFVRLHEGEIPAPPEASALRGNHPNPLTSSTLIRYDIGRGGPVTLRIYDVAGLAVRELEDGWRSVGRHVVRWDGTDATGRIVPSGMYFCRLDTPQGTSTHPMLLVR